jgi:hypothetical protein
VTIRKGEPWGSEVARPPGLVLAADDQAVVELGDDREVGLAGGDLYRSLGEPEPRDPVQRVDIDGITVVLDGNRTHAAVAHVIARRSWWRGPIVACMNVDHYGRWNVAPRAHPNDGLLDILECSPRMSVRDRWAARRRLPQGTHLPHPEVSLARVASRTWTFERPQHIWIDGRAVGAARHLAVTIVPDRYRILF